MIVCRLSNDDKAEPQQKDINVEQPKPFEELEICEDSATKLS